MAAPMPCIYLDHFGPEIQSRHERRSVALVPVIGASAARGLLRRSGGTWRGCSSGGTWRGCSSRSTYGGTGPRAQRFTGTVPTGSVKGRMVDNIDWSRPRIDIYRRRDPIDLLLPIRYIVRIGLLGTTTTGSMPRRSRRPGHRGGRGWVTSNWTPCGSAVNLTKPHSSGRRRRWSSVDQATCRGSVVAPCSPI
jgi:hypothetical protein